MSSYPGTSVPCLSFSSFDRLLPQRNDLRSTLPHPYKPLFSLSAPASTSTLFPRTDRMVGGGWARDELKESSFALLHWKARSRDGDLPRAGVDPRTEERWVLVEEVVPREYREALMADPKVRFSLFRPVVNSVSTVSLRSLDQKRQSESASCALFAVEAVRNSLRRPYLLPMFPLLPVLLRQPRHYFRSSYISRRRRSLRYSQRRRRATEGNAEERAQSSPLS
jgi:hypothetical protein